MIKYLQKYFNKDLIDKVLSLRKYDKNLNTNKTQLNMDVIKTLYIDYKLPLYKIAMLYGVSDATIGRRLKKEKCNMRGHRCGKNSNNNYFENIDSPDKAYYLGLIFADGNIRIDNRINKGISKIFQISLTEEDKYILETFNKYANFNTSLIQHHINDKKPRYGLCINSSKIYDDLIKLGVTPRKSKEGIDFIPKISEDLISHFIRGYFDGDGIAKKEGYIGFCGDLKIIQYIKSQLVAKCNVKTNTITYNKANHIYYIQWSSKKDIQSIFNYLYKDKSDLYLKRKYKKIKNRPFIQ